MSLTIETTSPQRKPAPMTTPSPKSSQSSVVVYRHNSTSIPEARRAGQPEAQKGTDNHPLPIQHDQSLAIQHFQATINTALETLVASIQADNSFNDHANSEADPRASGLDSVRKFTLKLCASVSTLKIDSVGPLQVHSTPDPLVQPEFDSAAEYLTVFCDTDEVDTSSENSFELVDPVEPSAHTSHSRVYDESALVDEVDRSSDRRSLPDWAFTITANGCQVPLFWEGADMGYFKWHQEQMEAGERDCV